MRSVQSPINRRFQIIRTPEAKPPSLTLYNSASQFRRETDAERVIRSLPLACSDLSRDTRVEYQKLPLNVPVELNRLKAAIDNWLPSSVSTSLVSPFHLVAS